LRRGHRPEHLQSPDGLAHARRLPRRHAPAWRRRPPLLALLRRLQRPRPASPRRPDHPANALPRRRRRHDAATGSRPPHPAGPAPELTTVTQMNSSEPGRTNLTYTTLNGRTWSIQPGTRLVIGPDTANEESVTVIAVTSPGNPPNYTFVSSRAHAAGERVI